MEYEYLFTTSLYGKLKEKIKGHIYCRVIDDILVIKINTFEGLWYENKIDNFAMKLMYGLLDSDQVANEVINEYKNIILKHFLY